MISRRAVLVGACAAAFECSRRETGSAGRPEPVVAPRVAAAAASTASAATTPDVTRLVSWGFPDNEPERAVTVVPTWGAAGERFPVVIALHGRGEALKTPSEGAMGWPRDYELVRAVRRLRAPPLTTEDFEGLIDDDALATMNRGLRAAPFRGLVVSCPYLPDLDLRRLAPQTAYGQFLLGVLVPRLRSETPALASPSALGIDGVSLGGALALQVGLSNPLAFGAVGAIQPAITVDDVAAWTERAVTARRANPSLKLRLFTSEEDYFREAVTRTSQAWRAAGVAHDFFVAKGPHDYIFNRGPGSIELLRWHDGALSRG